MAPRLLPLPPTMSVSLDLAAAVPTPGTTAFSGAQLLAGAVPDDPTVIAGLEGVTLGGGGDFAALLGLLEQPDEEGTADVPEPDAVAVSSPVPDAAAAALALVLPIPPAAPALSSSDGAGAASVTDAESAAPAPVATVPGEAKPGSLPDTLLAIASAAAVEPTPEDATVTTTDAVPDGAASAETSPATPEVDGGEADRRVAPRARGASAPASRAMPHAGSHADACSEVAEGAAPSPDEAGVRTAAPTTAAAALLPHAKERTEPAASKEGAPESSSPDPGVGATQGTNGTEEIGGAPQHEERAPGRRGLDGEAGKVVVPTLAHDETPTARRTDGGADPSAPSALPSAPQREAASPPTPAPAPEPARDVERLLRMHGLRSAPAPAPDRGEMRLEVATDLGRVEVRVAVRADAVHASLYAQHDQAREALETHRSTLAAALERSNLRLEGFTVGLGQHQQHAPGEEGRHDGVPVRNAPSTVALASVDDVVLEPAARSRGLSLRA